MDNSNQLEILGKEFITNDIEVANATANITKAPYERSLEDVTTILKHAKVDKSNLTEMTQAIYFPPASEQLDDFLLLELNSELIKAIESGETMFLKGGLHEKVVLCSEEKTFDIKVAEISNSLLLVPELKLAQATSSSPIKSPQNAANRSLDKSLDDNDDEDEQGSQVIPFKNIEKKVIKKVFHEYFECNMIKPRYKKTLDILQCTRLDKNSKLFFKY